MSRSEMSWNAFAKAIKKVACSVHDDGFNPDMIVAIARGGWIPARFLSNLLGVKDLASIGLKYTDEEREKLELYSFPQPIRTGAKLLLVEDLLESGKALLKAKSLLLDAGAIVRTACLYYRDSSILFPDYSLGIYNKGLKMPWEG